MKGVWISIQLAEEPQVEQIAAVILLGTIANRTCAAHHSGVRWCKEGINYYVTQNQKYWHAQGFASPIGQPHSGPARRIAGNSGKEQGLRSLGGAGSN